jgi:hypothetical protein
MKHPSSRAFYAYWNSQRGAARAPERSEIEPHALREHLGDIFVLAYDAPSGYPFRVAGTRVCALFGRDMKNSSFPALFGRESRGEIEEIISAVAEETLPAIAGLTAATPDGGRAHLELLLLPFQARAHMPISLTGLLAPFDDCRGTDGRGTAGRGTDGRGTDGRGTLGELSITSWRYLHQPERIVPRALRKLAIARGLMVYEGLR